MSIKDLAQVKPSNERRSFIGKEALGNAYLNFPLLGASNWLLYQKNDKNAELIELNKNSIEHATRFIIKGGQSYFKSQRNSTIRGDEFQKIVTDLFSNDAIAELKLVNDIIILTLKG